MHLNINTRECINLTTRLTQLHRSAFPVAVRSTLNDAAFKSKALIPQEADSEFTIRQKNLFKNFSGVNKATGFNLNTMKSEVGLTDKPGADKLVKGLATQEKGGTLKGRKLIPNDMGRVSGMHSKKLKAKNRFSNIRVGTRENRISGTKFFLLKKGNKGTVFENTGRGIKPIYVYRSNPNVNLRKKPFIEPSALKAAQEMDEFYRKNAEKQFAKYLR